MKKRRAKVRRNTADTLSRARKGNEQIVAMIQVHIQVNLIRIIVRIIIEIINPQVKTARMKRRKNLKNATKRNIIITRNITDNKAKETISNISKTLNILSREK